MPTGYTYRIEEDDDFTFPQFVWGCARAFGALVSMKEDPLDAAIPDELEPSPYYQERINEVTLELAQLDAMTADDVARRIREERDEAERDNAGYRARHEAVRRRYRAMRDRVEAWEPPTPDHAELKAFMLQQIDVSTRGDHCYQRDLPTPDPAEWLADRRAELLGDLGRAEEHWREEVERTNSRSEWLRQLRLSVPPGGSPDRSPGGSPGSWRDRAPLL